MNNFNFNDQKIIDGFNRELFFIIEEDSISKAYRFYFYLKKLLEEPSIKETITQNSLTQYQKMIIKAKFIALPLLDKKDVYNLINDHFNYSFNIEGYNLWGKIKDFLTNIDSLEERNKIKNNIKKILLNNKTLITKNNIKIGDKEVIPSVNNWLSDFLSQFGDEGFLDQIKLSSYFIKSKNVKSLSVEEKRRIESLLNLYKKMKISSNTLEGLEEDITIIKPDGEIGFIKQGQYEKIDSKAQDLYNKISGKEKGNFKIGINELKRMLIKYPPASLERRAIEEEIERLNR
jgi:hypothetical protein